MDICYFLRMFVSFCDFHGSIVCVGKSCWCIYTPTRSADISGPAGGHFVVNFRYFHRMFLNLWHFGEF